MYRNGTYSNGGYNYGGGTGSRPRRGSFDTSPSYSNGAGTRGRPRQDSFENPSRDCSSNFYSDASHPSYYGDDPRRRRRPHSPPGYSSTHASSSRPRSPSPYIRYDDSRRSYSPLRTSPHTSQPDSPFPIYNPAHYTSPPSPPPRPNSPVPYTYEDEEPDFIPHAPEPWNNHTTSSTLAQLTSLFIAQGKPRAQAERDAGRMFESHAPLHRAGETEARPSRFESEGRERERWRYREQERERSESPPSRSPFGGRHGSSSPDAYRPSFSDPFGSSRSTSSSFFSSRRRGFGF